MASPQVMVTRVPPGVLRARIDSAFYAPEHLVREQRLKQLGVARPAIGETASLVTDGTHKTPNYVESGVPFLSATNIGDGALLFGNHKFVTRAEFLQLRAWNCAPLPNDVVVAKSGSIGNAAVVPAGAQEFAVFESVAIVRCDRFDPYFLSTFLNSRVGQQEIKRQTKGAVIRHLHLEDLREVEVPEFSKDAQRYIGDKVRQAERLRERARCLEAGVATTHAQYIVPPTGIDFTKRTRRLPSRSLTERLDAHFYPSAVEQYVRQLSGATRPLDRLCSLVTNGQSQPEADEGVSQATVTNLGRSFIEGVLRTVEQPTGGARALAPHDLLLCNAAHNKSYIGRDVTYSQVEDAYPSTEVMIVRVDRTQIPASFVRHYLKTEIGHLQIQSTIRGITAHSYPSDVRLIEISIPAVSDADRDAWFATDDKMLEAGRCFDAAQILTHVATTLVEHLIDGRITEADLIAAQKALDGGDRSGDRALLQALRRSDAPDAKPLIADINALYALLDAPEDDRA